ncbi:hypothetical protein POSPLADRAFT_1033630 [Postia placenta MAD-698-R-SB12]|uniref:Uncharacterized protein n=1 Tax=Postia placenta MAD-698-R-SB12 TaxID=670580 RepID=A0A1X6N347_9APHY|nr:hypothetical protein POSPLADRAFT_1033630 [Postia placenta MAD-698-R-SB12]OSX63035.1 hypothetical protein POSPLADRAFT_1033630 [Postia placenta MAD-698-R-SB12]
MVQGAVASLTTSLLDWLAANPQLQHDMSDSEPSEWSKDRLTQEYAERTPGLHCMCGHSDEEPNWFPWPDKTCILDILRHLPCSLFSDTQMQMILWCLDILGVDNRPLLAVLKAVNEFLQHLCGITSIWYKGPLSDVYYVNDLHSIIVQDYFLYEPAKLRNGNLIILICWYTCKSPARDQLMFGKCWHLLPVLFIPAILGFIHEHILTRQQATAGVHRQKGIIIVSQLEDAQHNGIWAWDIHLKEMILVIPGVLALLGDNPMQSELACHVSLAGSGHQADSNSKHSNTFASSAGSHSKRAKKMRCAETLQELVDRARHFFAMLGHLQAIFQEASTVGGTTRAKQMKTETGMKDTFQDHFVNRIAAFSCKLHGSHGEKQAIIDEMITSEFPANTSSPIFHIHDLDVNHDTPVEILHVVLLGFIKYFWCDAIACIPRDHKDLLKTWLSSLDVSGLGLPSLAGETLVTYVGSLTGRNFQTISQVASFVLYNMVSAECFDAWLMLCTLVPLIWQPVIEDLESHLVLNPLMPSFTCKGSIAIAMHHLATLHDPTSGWHACHNADSDPAAWMTAGRYPLALVHPRMDVKNVIMDYYGLSKATDAIAQHSLGQCIIEMEPPPALRQCKLVQFCAGKGYVVGAWVIFQTTTPPAAGSSRPPAPSIGHVMEILQVTNSFSALAGHADKTLIQLFMVTGKAPHYGYLQLHAAHWVSVAPLLPSTKSMSSPQVPMHYVQVFRMEPVQLDVEMAILAGACSEVDAWNTRQTQSKPCKVPPQCKEGADPIQCEAIDMRPQCRPAAAQQHHQPNVLYDMLEAIKYECTQMLTILLHTGGPKMMAVPLKSPGSTGIQLCPHFHYENMSGLGTLAMAASHTSVVPSSSPPGFSPHPETSSTHHMSFDKVHIKQWLELVANCLQLRSEQYSDLQVFIELGEDLEPGDICIHIYQQATQYCVLNNVEVQSVAYGKFMEQLRRDKDLLGFTQIYGNPLLKSVSLGAAQCSLEQATWLIATKFKMGSPGSTLSADYQIHIVILHRLMWENSGTLDASDLDMAEVDESSNEDDAVAATAPKK